MNWDVSNIFVGESISTTRQHKLLNFIGMKK